MVLRPEIFFITILGISVSCATSSEAFDPCRLDPVACTPDDEIDLLGQYIDAIHDMDVLLVTEFCVCDGEPREFCVEFAESRVDIDNSCVIEQLLNEQPDVETWAEQLDPLLSSTPPIVLCITESGCEIESCEDLIREHATVEVEPPWEEAMNETCRL